MQYTIKNSTWFDIVLNGVYKNIYSLNVTIYNQIRSGAFFYN